MNRNSLVERMLGLTDQLEALASEMRDSEPKMTTKEQWAAHELLVSAAAHSRGAAAQLYKESHPNHSQSQVT